MYTSPHSIGEAVSSALLVFAAHGEGFEMGDGCQVFNVLLSQLSTAVGQLKTLESQRPDASDIQAVAILDQERQRATETVQRFREAVRIHVAICRFHGDLAVTDTLGESRK